MLNRKVVLASAGSPSLILESSRDRLIGQLVRLGEKTGIPQFIRAISAAIKRNPESEFIIAGDRPPMNEIDQCMKRLGLGEMARITRWISYGNLAGLLDELRSIEIRSYTEGLPNVLPEARARETLVPATLVGTIPDILVDEETGFLLEDNSPVCKVDSTSHVSESAKLEEAARRTHSAVMTKFDFEKEVRSWESILDVINEGSENQSQ